MKFWQISILLLPPSERSELGGILNRYRYKAGFSVCKNDRKEKKSNLWKYHKKNVFSRPTFCCRSDGNVFGLIFDHFQVRNGRLMSKNGIFLHFFTFGPITNDHFWSNLIIIWKISIFQYFNYFSVFYRLVFQCRSNGTTLNIVCFTFLASKWPF